MTWPSPQLPLPTNQTNATVQLDTHPADHATTNLAINDDIAPELTRVGGIADQNVLDIATNAANLADHENSAIILTGFGNVVIYQGGTEITDGYSLPIGTGAWTIRHGIFHGWWETSWGVIAGGGGVGGDTWIETPVSNAASLLAEGRQTAYGQFRPATSNSQLQPVAFQWDESESLHRMIAVGSVPLGFSFPAIDDGGLLRMVWTFPTNRADTL